MAPAASGGPWINGDSTSRERLASPYFNTHDKSLRVTVKFPSQKLKIASR